ncbi:MAG: hypothetical protein K1X75_17200 [Leptospirales bacterium]|nr:hypothetical protein [Leptospirales bacterium]
MFSLLLPAALLAGACTPSAELQRMGVAYNFLDEGFLDRHTLQTLGRSQMESSGGGLDADRSRCLTRALDEARLRAVRAMLHLRDSIPPLATDSSYNQSAFESDYPRRFPEAELRRAQSEFAALLERGYIALQDARSQDSCKLAFRIVGEDLPREIRATPGRQRQHRDQPWNREQQRPIPGQLNAPAAPQGGASY